MAAKKQRREYDDVFKDAALKRIEAGEKVGAVAKDLKVSDSVIYGWIKRKRDMGDTATSKKPDTVNNVKDAIIYLKQAEALMIKRIRSGKIKAPDGIQLRMMLALKSLTGED